jgi:hypothetical protein
MERLDALALVNRIEAAWPNERWTQPRIDQYIDGIHDLDPGAAGTALVRLIRSCTKAPTVADFRTATRALDTRTPARALDRCDECDGTGWAQAPDIDIDGHTYTQVAPCACESGKAVA